MAGLASRKVPFWESSVTKQRTGHVFVGCLQSSFLWRHNTASLPTRRRDFSANTATWTELVHCAHLPYPTEHSKRSIVTSHPT